MRIGDAFSSSPSSGDSWTWGFARRRKLLITAFIVLVVPAFLFLKELDSSTTPSSLLELPSSGPPQHHIASITAETVTVFMTATPLSELPATATTETLYQKPPPYTVEPAVFVLVMWSAPSAAEGSLLMKTILMYTSVPIDFHIICDSEAQVFVEQRLSLVTHPAYDVRVFFYLPSWQSMLDRVEREGSIKTDHSAGLPGLMKLFIHEIVPPDVKKGIYIDTDALFISDPALLWDVFSRLKPTTSIVMGSHPDQDSPEWSHASRICSCVMLLDLDKLRKGRLMDSSIWKGTQPEALSPPTFRKMYGDPGLSGTDKYANVRLGDQGYWWAIVDGRPDIFEPLSFDFEITSCLMDTYMIGLGHDTTTEEEEMSRQIHVKDTPQEGQVILPKLLHFNCLHGTPIYMEWKGWSDPNDFLNERWGPAVRYHQGYKWIWLNKGKNLRTTLEMTTLRNMLFADERFALEHGIAY